MQVCCKLRHVGILNQMAGNQISECSLKENHFSYAWFFMLMFIHVDVVVRFKKMFLSLLLLGVSSVLQLRDIPPPPLLCSPSAKVEQSSRCCSTCSICSSGRLLQVYSALQMKINSSRSIFGHHGGHPCVLKVLCSHNPLTQQNVNTG